MMNNIYSLATVTNNTNFIIILIINIVLLQRYNDKLSQNYHMTV